MTEQRGCRAWAGAVRAAIPREGPSTSLDAIVVLAGTALVDIGEVGVEVDIVSERCFMAPLALRCAPRRAVVPPRSLGNLGLWCAEQLGRRSVPCRLRRGPHLHIRVHITGHLAASNLVLFSGACVVLVGLRQLPTSSRRGVGRASSFRHSGRVAPVVFVAGVVSDRLLHALGQEGCDVDQSVLHVSSSSTHPKLRRTNAAGGHYLDGLHHVRPGV
mmetsp:Transcript_32338/g.69240  ORF Transcript_32338/g.69240 Transcript_32338/m.69240 type:complete len:216 (+) Transcript_32338:1204-1851(+)